MAGWWPSGLERRIALRYLRGQRGTRSASLQTLVSVGGFATGVTALILVLGVMNGLSIDLRDKILIASPHLRILTTDPGMRFPNWEAQQVALAEDPEVLSVTPEVSSETIIRNEAGYYKGVLVMGMEPGADPSDLGALAQLQVIEGAAHFAPSDDLLDGGVLVGDKLARAMGIRVGDRLVTMPPKAIERAGTGVGVQSPRWWEVEVTGIFRTGMIVYDDHTMIMDRATAQDFAGLGTAVSDLAVRVRDPERADLVAARLLERLGGFPYRAETWRDANGPLFRAMALEKLAMGLVIFIIMVVAAFNIVGTLTMVVAFKTREIGILLAMGLPTQSLRRIFMTQGAIIGLVGTVIGVVLGVTIGLIVDRSGLIRIDPEIYFLDRLPIRIQILDVLIVVAASLVTSVAATVHPSRRAAALAPVDAIRAE